MTGFLTTHVLDVMNGTPANEMKIELFEIKSEKCNILAHIITNQDGRSKKPILANEVFKIGEYELLFYVGDYFSAKDTPLNNGQFLDIVPVRFKIDDKNSHYHVPLLVTPYGYSTYRGS